MTQNAETTGKDWFPKTALIIALVLCIIIFFTSGCNSGVGSQSIVVNQDPCTRAGIDPWEEQTIMNAAIDDSAYFSYNEARQAGIDACWNNSVSVYQADNCAACVVLLVNTVYSSP